MTITYLELQPRQPTLLDSVEGTSVYPLTLSPVGFSDLVLDRSVLVQGSSTIGLWVSMSSGTNAKFKVLGSVDGVDYYTLPIVGFSGGESITLKPHVVEFNATTGDNKYIFSVPLSDIIRYAIVRVMGTGQLLEVKVSVK